MIGNKGYPASRSSRGPTFEPRGPSSGPTGDPYLDWLMRQPMDTSGFMDLMRDLPFDKARDASKWARLLARLSPYGRLIDAASLLARLLALYQSLPVVSNERMHGLNCEWSGGTLACHTGATAWRYDCYGGGTACAPSSHCIATANWPPNSVLNCGGLGVPTAIEKMAQLSTAPAFSNSIGKWGTAPASDVRLVVPNPDVAYNQVKPAPVGPEPDVPSMRPTRLHRSAGEAPARTLERLADRPWSEPVVDVVFERESGNETRERRVAVLTERWLESFTRELEREVAVLRGAERAKRELPKTKTQTLREQPSNRPPRTGVKERKFTLRSAMGTRLSLTLGAVGEVGDFIECLHDALPKKYQAKAERAYRPETYKGAAPFKTRKASLKRRTKAVYDHFGRIDWLKASRCLEKNMVEDFVIGTAGKAVARAANRAGFPGISPGIGPAL